MLAAKNVCAWTDGTWYFDVTDVRQWDRVQNTQPDIRALSNHLVKIVRDQSSAKVAYVLSELAKALFKAIWWISHGRITKSLGLFSGGQDSATCLAWALDNFDRNLRV